MVVVVGGGQIGTYHARQLRRAVLAGEVGGPVVVVDRDPTCLAAQAFAGDPLVRLQVADWTDGLASWLARADAGDHLVPAPFQPHLLWSWLAAEAGLSPAPAPAGWALPYEVADASGTRFLSAAAWRCPATCVEPSHCPALHAPRDWNLGDVLTAGARERGYEPAIFHCLHLAQGIASVRVAEIQEVAERARESPGRLLVATTSRCHAAVGALLRPVE